MSKLLILSAALTMVGGVSSIASAQCACCGTQSYQRYSYQPSAVSQAPAIQRNQTRVPGQASNGNVGNAVVVQPQAGVSQSQSYRRYSYQPQSTYQSYQPQPTYRPQTSRSYSASPRKNPWEYAKGERQRYLP